MKPLGIFCLDTQIANDLSVSKKMMEVWHIVTTKCKAFSLEIYIVIINHTSQHNIIEYYKSAVVFKTFGDDMEDLMPR